MTADTQYDEPPEGTRALRISMREMDSLGLKTGKSMRDTVPYKTFDRAELVAQIKHLGVLSPFYGLRDEISVDAKLMLILHSIAYCIKFLVTEC